MTSSGAEVIRVIPLKSTSVAAGNSQCQLIRPANSIEHIRDESELHSEGYTTAWSHRQSEFKASCETHHIARVDFLLYQLETLEVIPIDAFKSRVEYSIVAVQWGI